MVLESTSAATVAGYRDAVPRHRRRKLLVADEQAENSLAEACRVTTEGGTYITSKPINIRYFYEVLSLESPLQVGFKVERAVKEYLIQTLILDSCPQANRRLVVTPGVRGVEVGGSGILSEHQCSKLKSDIEPKLLPCYTMIGSNTVFLDEDKIDLSLVEVEKSITEHVYSALQDHTSIGLDIQDGIFGLATISQSDLALSKVNKESEDDTEATAEPTTTNQEAEPRQIPQQRDNDPVVNHLSLTGILLLLFSGAMFTLATLYFWTTIRNKEAVVQEVEEELSLREEAFDFRVVVGANSRSEIDVTHDICFCYTTDEEVVEQVEISNPFAVRNGRTLQWRSVNMTVVSVFIWLRVNYTFECYVRI